MNLFPEESCNTKYDISGSSDIAKNREKFLPNRFNSTVICAGSTVSKFDKVNSVQEACAECFAVHILKFEILQTTWKTKQKTSKC